MDKEFDFSTAKRPSDVPALQQLRQAHQNSIAQNKAFDDDVISWVAKQDSNTRQRINEILRQMMGMGIYQAS